jgi:glycosyltransferase involved in cell wall biosynthesis
MVTTFYPPYFFGGDGMFIYRLSNALAERGHHVAVVHCIDAYRSVAPRGATPQGSSYPHHLNVTLHSLKSRAGILSPLITQQTGLPGLKASRLRQILDEGQFDVINYHNMSLMGPAALSYGSGIKLYTMHEHWLVCPMHVLWKFNRVACDHKHCFACTLHGKRPPQLWRYTGFLDSMLEHIDAFIAVSRFSRQKHLDMGLSVSAPIEHIPYFVPWPDHAPEPTGDAGTSHPRPYFLFVGRLEKLKGVQVLIDAFKHYRNADLLIVGDGSYEAEVRAQAQGLGHVRFLGRMPYEQLQALFRDAIALLVPSVGYETLGIVILEALVQRTPVIVHNLGALPEIVEQSGGGLIYNNESELLEALETLRLDAGLRRDLGERGQRACFKYWTPEAHLPQYLGLVERIAAQKGIDLRALEKVT